MSSWRDEYLTSLKDAELQSPVNQELIQTCSQMADRISALEASNAALEARASKAPKAKASKSGALPTTDDPAIAQLRLDLAESLRSKGVTEGRLRAAEEELSKLRTKTKDDARSVKALSTERALLTTRLKDREHELREKRKLLEDVQDEMITLNLQMSMAEKERDKVKRENKELVERWMARMAQEAEAMNLANEPLLGT
ncbi:autophagy protein 16, interacts with Atg12p-Atg5p [Claviceps purpurea]|nr:autophagy protein 16, interacts with Atg12p-Atg5p [Claviceps purpurea]KAG6192813.1 autophagy protein 16, interacts with Atg12p-Atg5p [Claviceps purpurea]KAG6293448.1 autophagy protein 16, interacts with Atg12p-Atg5p [Claviceps purpurea]KAG6312556.1 autophagy protein 16, interacts with Atg12p-Atg5p [Claviceps purpurea]KAG6317579.1 autophagy protein 16, interacts with Atg12p-Atg5p [Claviceps purpurea]